MDSIRTRHNTTSHLMFPDTYHGPAVGAQPAEISAIPLSVLFDFLLPERCQLRLPGRESITTPEVAIYEDHLADGLSHLPEDAGHRDLWIAAMPSAVGKVKCGSAVKEGVAAINTALHVALPRADKISARERGAVVAVPCQSLFRHRFSTDEATVRARFAISTDVPVRWVGIQVEAACDHAQRKSLSIPFVLGAEIAADVKVKQKPGGVWESPVFPSDEDKAVKIVVNVGLTASVPAVKASRRNALYRFRESLLNSLAMIKAQHETRPGIIMLDGND